VSNSELSGEEELEEENTVTMEGTLSPEVIVAVERPSDASTDQEKRPSLFG